MYRTLDENNSSQNQTISTKLKSTIQTFRQKFRTQPLLIFRLIFWTSVWILSVAELASAIRFFKVSVNFILTNNNGPQTSGIEDARRQAIPVLVMVAVLLTVLMPITIVLPMFGVLKFLSRMTVEITWTFVLSLILLGAAAGLAPIASSLTLPSILQPTYSTVIGLAFTIFILLFGYTFLLILLYVFHRGRGTSKVHTASIKAILYPSDSLSNETLVKYNLSTDLEKSTYTNSLTRPETSLAQPPQAYQAGRAWTSSPVSELQTPPSSGWDDDDDDDKPANHARREKRRTRK
ncbi:hypothetical protein CROQUDRAFT_674252 [Cronartium quercuum f. sp. fusiforme G11]|uniref:Uncharacterized protein n=1 Tax=Cronartium quercuum f. sp. fusiforme G11 TaxID=708437 RepID=A0A9P6N8Y8_9BASI|nr:hypothetical protein CROQUDRAFT_674252 [Cronartium quercuum f. sp. fusiforme G11]